MANTRVRIKKSTVTNTPADGSLQSGELAYTYSSNVIFIGGSDNSGVIPIGGYNYVLKINTAYDIASAAFDAANTANGNTGDIGPAFDKANSVYTYAANTVMSAANSAYGLANTTYTYAANTVMSVANSAYAAQNTTYTFAANNVRIIANSAYAAANTTYTYAANTVMSAANAAYAKANSALPASGGVISGDLSITGNLTLVGQTTFANTNTLRITDPLIFLAGNNFTSDVIDIGFVGNYVNAQGSNVSTGLYREHTRKEYFLFQEYNKNVDENNHIDPSANGFILAVLNADLRTSNLNLARINAHSWLTAAYGAANSTYTYAANTVMSAANAAYAAQNTTYTFAANTVRLIANTAYGAANTTYTYAANTVMSVANSAYAAQNTTYTFAANTVRLIANSAYAGANAAYTYAANTVMSAANAAYDKANSANINASNASYLTQGTVHSDRISGSYVGITGVGTLTQGVWNASIIDVTYGGTGVSSFTANGVLFGNGTGALKATIQGAEGEVLQVSANGMPFFGIIDGGTF